MIPCLIRAEGPLQEIGMRQLYECYPNHDSRVIPASNLITRACLTPCFLDGNDQYHTIPHRFHRFARQYFDGGQADTAKPSGRGSKLFELNLYAMNFGQAKPRTESVSEELAKRKARKAAAQASAAAKRKETWAQKRARSGQPGGTMT